MYGNHLSALSIPALLALLLLVFPVAPAQPVEETMGNADDEQITGQSRTGTDLMAKKRILSMKLGMGWLCDQIESGESQTSIAQSVGSSVPAMAVMGCSRSGTFRARERRGYRQPGRSAKSRNGYR